MLMEQYCNIVCKMRFDDDDPIVAPQVKRGQKPRACIAGKIKLTIINKNEAPFEKTSLKVMPELIGAGSNYERPGLDVVMAIDVSQNMKGAKLQATKLAMGFVIQKLTPIDRLSIVTFNQGSNRLCPLRQMTGKTRLEVENLVSCLAASRETASINAGLEMAIKVIDDRVITRGRVAAIMLLSNGDRNKASGDVREVSVKHVPVYTFGFGCDINAEELNCIAKNSNGGTFSVVDVENTESSNLSIAFSQCIDGLLTVVAQDLKLTVKRVKSDIEKVTAESYPISEDHDAGSLSISFGDLYNKEIRRVMVYLLLPAVESKVVSTQVLQITYSYSVEGELFEAPPILVSVIRTRQPVEQRLEAIEIEEKRLETAQLIHEARLMADKNNLDEAQDMIVEAQNKLEDVTLDQPNPSVEMLKYELLILLRLMQSQQVYTKKGHPYALASKTCHDRQRFVTRGHVEKLRLFATLRMNAYLDQVSMYEDDPTKSLPMDDDDDDAEEEHKKHPLEPLIVPHLQVINESVKLLHESLKSIQDVLLNF